MLNQQWLVTFLTLVETGHFTRTAEQLFMTQPGVTQHIKKLEKQLKTPLLIRQGRGFDLTYAGQQVYKYGCQLQLQEQSLLQQLQQDDPHRGEVCIGCSGALALQLFPHLLELQQAFPGLRIALEAAPNPSISDGIIQGELDLGIITQPSSPQGFAVSELGQEELCLVLPRMKMTEPITLEQLERLGFVDHPDAAAYIERVLRANFSEYRGLERIPRRSYINQLHQILLPVAAGIGFTVLPQTAVAQFEHADQLTVGVLGTPVRDPRWMISKLHRRLPKRFEWISQHIQRLLK